MPSERERASEEFGLRANGLFGALAFALDVVLPLEERPIRWQRVWCDECACWANHNGVAHRRAVKNGDYEP